jgi:hypothetical protein
MSVDGFLFQAGGLVFSTATYKSPFSINATFWPAKSRFSLQVSPPVNVRFFHY